MFLLAALLTRAAGAGGEVGGGRYLQCQRGTCGRVGDREVGWEHDQPAPALLTPDTRAALAVERLPGILFDCPASPPSLALLPPTIHLIWLGSPLPARYIPGPASLAALNPDYTVMLWLDHPAPAPTLPFPNILIKDVGGEVWQCRDLLADCTNYAQRSDVLRLEIIQRYGGIYVDVDAVAMRSFGPVFSTSFLSHRPANWTGQDGFYSRLQHGGQLGTAGIGKDSENNVFGFPSGSPFLQFVLCALRQNFNRQTATLLRTGPTFFKEAFLQYPAAGLVRLVDWRWVGAGREGAVLVDRPGDSDWDDRQDLRRTTTVTLPRPGPSLPR